MLDYLIKEFLSCQKKTGNSTPVSLLGSKTVAVKKDRWAWYRRLEDKWFTL